MAKTTIKQVAEHAKVSKATVSRVLNDDPKVDVVLKKRVLTSVKALQYVPSGVARSLRRQETLSIGMVVPDNRNPFFAEIANSIENVLYETEYSLYLCNSAEDASKEFIHCQHLYRQRVAGVIIATTGQSTKGIKYLKDRGLPLILVDRGYTGSDIDTVMANHYQGACEVTEYLLGLGHRTIGLIAGPEAHPPVRDRLIGYLDTLAKYGLQQDPMLIHWHPHFEYEVGYEGTRRFLSLSKRPTAIFAFNDIMAIGALSFTLEKGIKVPGELSIVGVDDIPLSRFVTPKLTTVAQPMSQIGRTAARTLLRRLQEKSAPFTRQVLDSKVVIRGSTGPVSG